MNSKWLTVVPSLGLIVNLSTSCLDRKKSTTDQVQNPASPSVPTPPKTENAVPPEAPVKAEIKSGS
jgi:hypothetical protein